MSTPPALQAAPQRLVPSRSRLLVPRSELNPSLTFSADLAHHARVRQLSSEKWEVRVDGKAVSTDLDGVLDGTPVLSPDGSRAGWGERTPEGWRVSLGGKTFESAKALGRVGLVVSEDGHFAWQTQTDQGWITVLDGDPGPVWADLGPPVLSAGGGHMAYAARGTEGPVIVRDGEVTPLAGDPVAASFSADGSTFRLVVRRPDGLHWTDGTQEEGPFTDLGSPVHAPLGQRWALPRHVNGQWQVVVDGEVVSTHDRVGHPGPVFSPDGQHIAWWAEDGDLYRVLRDGTPGRTWRVIGDLPLTWSDDGQHVAWLASTSDEVGTETWHVVVDDLPFLPREQVAALTLSPDGSWVAWVGREGGGWAVRLGRTRDGEVYSTDLVEGVGTEFGGGIAFDDGVLRYTAIDGLGLSVHDLDLPE